MHVGSVTRGGQQRAGASAPVGALVLAVALVASGLVACSGGGSSDARAPYRNVCDEWAALGCVRPTTDLSLPIDGSPYRLTYRSDLAAEPGTTAPVRTALGGWGLDVVHALDVEAGVLVLGSGIERSVAPLPATVDGASGYAVASVDGSEIYRFDAAGRHVETRNGVTGAMVRVVRWRDGQPWIVADNTGPAVVVTPGKDGRVELRTEGGYVTRLSIDAGHLVRVVAPDGATTRLSADGDGRITRLTDPAGSVTRFGYDSGDLAEVTGPTGLVTRVSTERSDDSITVTRRAGGRTSSDSVTWAGPSQRRLVHVDSRGRTTMVDERQGSRRTTAPDGTTAVVDLAEDPTWGWQAPIPGRSVRRTRAARTSTVEVQRAAAGARAGSVVATSSTVTVDGRTWASSYDPDARRFEVTDPAGRSSSAVVDARGRVVRVDRPGTAPHTATYDSAGRLASLTIGTGAAARTWKGSVTTASRSTTDPTGRVVTQEIDAAGRVRRVILPDDARVDFGHDEAGRLTAWSLPGGSGYGMPRDAAGRVSALRAPPSARSSGSATVRRNPFGQVTAVSRPDGDRLAIAYASTGVPSAIDTGAATTAVSFDRRADEPTRLRSPAVDQRRVLDGGDLVSESWAGPFSVSVQRSLDPLGRTTRTAVTGLAPVSISYDESSLPTAVGPVSIARDPSSGRVTADEIGALSRAWGYDAFGDVARMDTTGPAGSIERLTLTRDDLGRVTGRATTGSAGSRTESFTYDLQGQLRTVTSNGVTTTFTFDPDGNLVKRVTAIDAPVEATYSPAGAVLTAGDHRYSYDGAGRLSAIATPDGTTKLAYDQVGALRSVTPPGGAVTEFVVDGQGRRVAARRSGSLQYGFAYDDRSRVAAEIGPDGKVRSQFLYVGDDTVPTAMLRAGATYLFVVDQVGSPRLVVDAATGKVAQRLTYDALGAVTSDSAPGFQPFGFAGGLREPVTGLVRFGARDYDPATGRWTAPDPIAIAAGDPNLYRYVGNDPVNGRDPSGLRSCTATFNCGGAVVVGGSGGVGVGVGPDGPFVTGSADPIYGIGFGCGIVFTCVNGPRDGGADASSDISIGPISYGKDVVDGQRGGHIGFSVGKSSLISVSTTFPPSDPGAPGGPAIPPDDMQYCPPGVDCSPCTAGGSDCQSHQPPPCQGNGSGCSSDQPPCPDGSYVCNPDNPPEDPPEKPPKDPPDKNPPKEPGSPGGPGSNGDPHMWTLDDVRYDFMAAGEFTLLRAGDLVVQTRQEPFANTPEASGNTAVAMSVAGDRVAIYAMDPRAIDTRAPRSGEDLFGLVLRVNGVVSSADSPLQLRHGGSIEQVQGTWGPGFSITWPDGSQALVLTVGVEGLNVSIADLPARAARSGVGLIGATDDGRLVGRDRRRTSPYDREAIHKVFGPTWRISQQESLFDYAPGQSTRTFDRREFPRRATPLRLTPAARAACARVADVHLRKNCVFDVSLTGDVGLARSYEDLQSIVVPPRFAVPSDSARLAAGTTSGRLAKGTDARAYRFAVPAGGSRTFRADPTCTTSGEANWRVIDAEGRLVRGPMSLCADLGTVAFAGGGTYRVVVAAGGESKRAYRFSAPIPHNDVTALKDGPNRGTLAQPGDTDTFGFTVAAGAVRSFLADPACVTGDSQVRWGIVDGKGGSVRSPSYSICSDLGRVTFEKAGTYSVVIFSDRGSGTRYSFTSRPVGGGSGRLADGRTEGVLARAGDVASYRFTAEAGTTRGFYADPACTQATLAMRWGVIDAKGRTVVSPSYPICSDIGRVTFAKAGTYRVVVYSDKGDGNRFAFVSYPSRSVRVRLRNGVNRGSLPHPGDTASFSFDAAAGSTRSFLKDPACKGATLDMRWGIFDAKGGTVVSPSYAICIDIGRVTFEDAGTYKVVVFSDGNTDNTFAFTTSTP